MDYKCKKRVYVVKNPASHNLPVGYTEVEYLETGTTNECYFNIGGIQANTSIELKLKMPEIRTYIDSYFGNNEASSKILMSIDNSQYSEYPKYFNALATAKFPDDKTQPHIYKMAQDGIYYDGTFLSGYSSTPSATDITNNVFLLGCYGCYWKTKSGTKLYYCSLSRNGQLVKYLIPAKRNSDSVLGMYDLVSETFFENAGTGTFIAGNEIPSKFIYTCSKRIRVVGQPRLPNEYQEVEYIQSNESTTTSYINTLIIPNQTTEIDLKVLVPNGENSANIFGENGASNQYLYITLSNTKCSFGNAKLTQQLYTDDGLPHIYKMDKNSLFVDNTEYFYNTTVNDFQSSSYLYINGVYYFYSKAPTGTRTYYCKIKQNGSVVRDYIPAIRKSDSVVGLYDLISQTFFVGANQDCFISGPDVFPQKQYVSSKRVYHFYDKLNVGGKIFYIDETSSGGTYIFYDNNGNVMTDIQVGDTPAYYVVLGTPNKPKYYVFNDTKYSNLKWTYGSTYESLGTTNTLGSGKTNTQIVMNASSGAYKTTSGTIWNRLNNLNTNKLGGCDDWFIGSRVELEALRTAVDRNGNALTTLFNNNSIWCSFEYSTAHAYMWHYTASIWTYDAKIFNHDLLVIRSF